MRMITVTAVIIGTVAIGSISRGLSQTPETTETRLRKLEQSPEPLYIVPETLKALVDLSQAAVIGRIVGLGDLQFLDDTSSSGKLMGVDAFASYDVSVTDVLFMKHVAGAPVLPVGQTVVLTQVVSGREARAFVNRQLPVSVGQEYLMFLWHRPRASSWSALQWSLQFRHSATTPGGAESVAALPDTHHFLTPTRLGASIPILSSSGNGALTVEWSALVTEIKRLAPRSTEPPKDRAKVLVRF